MGAIAFTKADPASGLFSGIFSGQPTPVVDNKRMVRGTIVFSNSYASGGDTLALTSLGLKEVTHLWIEASFVLGFVSGLSITLGGTKTSPTIVAFDTNGTQVTATTDLSTRTAIPVMLLGS